MFKWCCRLVVVSTTKNGYFPRNFFQYRGFGRLLHWFKAFVFNTNLAFLYNIDIEDVCWWLVFWVPFPLDATLFFCWNFKTLDVNFVQKCQICVENENLIVSQIRNWSLFNIWKIKTLYMWCTWNMPLLPCELCTTNLNWEVDYAPPPRHMSNRQLSVQNGRHIGLT